ncbi:MAG: CcmD family protein [Candidatus Methanofastidiosia archaeon]
MSELQTVMLANLIIWIGIFLYLIRLDRMMRELKKVRK